MYFRVFLILAILVPVQNVFHRTHCLRGSRKVYLVYCTDSLNINENTSFSLQRCRYQRNAKKLCDKPVKTTCSQMDEKCVKCPLSLAVVVQSIRTRLIIQNSTQIIYSEFKPFSISPQCKCRNKYLPEYTWTNTANVLKVQFKKSRQYKFSVRLTSHADNQTKLVSLDQKCSPNVLCYAANLDPCKSYSFCIHVVKAQVCSGLSECHKLPLPRQPDTPVIKCAHHEKDILVNGSKTNAYFYKYIALDANNNSTVLWSGKTFNNVFNLSVDTEKDVLMQVKQCSVCQCGSKTTAKCLKLKKNQASEIIERKNFPYDILTGILIAVASLFIVIITSFKLKYMYLKKKLKHANERVRPRPKSHDDANVNIYETINPYMIPADVKQIINL